MKKFVSQLLCCAVMALSANAGERATVQKRVLRISDPNPPVVCQDSMETVPATDELEPVLIPAADLHCKAPQMPISA